MGALASYQKAAITSAFSAAYGEDFDVAFQTALVRCEEGEWGPDQGNEVKDFVALALGSMMVGKDASDTQPGAQGLLARTYVVLAKQDGWDGQATPKPSTGDGAQDNLLIAVVVALAAIIIVAEAAAVAYCVYRATQVVTHWLATNQADRELMRAHKDAMQVVQVHQQKEALVGHAIAYDEGELAILQRLQQAQDDATKIVLATVDQAGKPPVSPDLGDGVLIGLLAAAAGLFLLTRR